MCELDNINPIKVNGNHKSAIGVPYTGFLTRVANDGSLYTKQSALYIIHDSRCMDCRPISGICKVKVSIAINLLLSVHINIPFEQHFPAHLFA